MKHQLPRFSVPMPGAKVKWPFEKKNEKVCGHNDVKKVLVDGRWLCRRCKELHDHPERALAL